MLLLVPYHRQWNIKLGVQLDLGARGARIVTEKSKTVQTIIHIWFIHLLGAQYPRCHGHLEVVIHRRI